jgi:V/A-type H+-transporting ATPase subunit K
MNSRAVQLKRRINRSLVGLFSVLAIIGTLFVFESFAESHNSTEKSEVSTHTSTQSGDARAMWAFIAAAISFGLGAIGAGIAISSVGAAAMGAVSEKPEIAGQALIFVALAEGVVVFGFIMGLLILGTI